MAEDQERILNESGLKDCIDMYIQILMSRRRHNGQILMSYD